MTSELYQLVRAQFPNIRLQISEAWTGHIRRDLLDGKLDCGAAWPIITCYEKSAASAGVIPPTPEWLSTTPPNMRMPRRGFLG